MNRFSVADPVDDAQTKRGGFYIFNVLIEGQGHFEVSSTTPILAMIPSSYVKIPMSVGYVLIDW